MSTRLGFAFAPAYRLPALALGIAPSTAYAEVGDGRLRVRFGPWSLETPLANVADVEETGGFAFLKTVGPPHLSLTDRGITFATNGARAACVRFHEPVAAIEPTGTLRHPGATLTLADVDTFAALLEAA